MPALRLTFLLCALSIKTNEERCRSSSFLIPEVTPLTRFALSQPAGRNLCLRCPRPIAAKLVDRSICGLVPQIAPFSMRTLTRPARRDFYPRYVRPTSVRIKGATPCLHFVRGTPGTKQSGAPHSAPDCLVPKVTPLAAVTA